MNLTHSLVVRREKSWICLVESWLACSLYEFVVRRALSDCREFGASAGVIAAYLAGCPGLRTLLSSTLLRTCGSPILKACGGFKFVAGCCRRPPPVSSNYRCEGIALTVIVSTTVSQISEANSVTSGTTSSGIRLS